METELSDLEKGITETSPGGRPPNALSVQEDDGCNNSELGASPISAGRGHGMFGSCFCGAVGMEEDGRLGRLPSLTTVREVDVLSVLPGVGNIEERKPLLRRISTDASR
jgi:hypothetical protein